MAVGGKLPAKNPTIPLTPEEGRKAALKRFPAYVIEGVNNIIAENMMRKNSFSVTQEEVIKAILSVAPKNVTRDDLFDKNYMDFEGLFSTFGWDISYDKPGYCETYDARYDFKPKKK